MSLEKLQKQYDKILNETKEISIPIVNRLTGNPSPAEAIMANDDGIIQRPCGVHKHVPKLDPVQLAKAQKKQEEIVTQVDENPFEYPDAAQVRGDISAGHGTGESRERITLPIMGKPKWFKALKNIVKGFGRPTRSRGRDYYDIESLVRNVPEKESVRQKKRGDLVFTIIDTSGSMLERANTGRTYMQELGKYIPLIVEDYDGEVIVIDTEIKDPIYKNKEIKKAMKAATKNSHEQKSLMMAGGGGTNMTKAYEYIIRKKREEKFEALVILLTDGGLMRTDLPPNMIQEIASTILVMPKDQLPNIENNHPIFMNMVASPQYPAVQIIAIDFKKEE
jgi:hypothetical protein